MPGRSLGWAAGWIWERGGGCEKAGKGKSGQSRTSCHRLGLALLGVQRGLGGEDSFWWRVEAGFGM
jgi:hypothetical protein